MHVHNCFPIIQIQVNQPYLEFYLKKSIYKSYQIRKKSIAEYFKLIQNFYNFQQVNKIKMTQFVM